MTAGMRKTNIYLFCATDAGGVSVIAPLAHRSPAHDSVTVVTLEKYLPEFTGRGISARSFDEEVSFLKTAEGLLDSIRPTAVICGTTRYSSLDRWLIRVAQERGIRTVVVLDDWTNYRQRFQDGENHLMFLPDSIAVMDELARNDAIKEGIPDKILHISGHVALTEEASHTEEYYAKSLPPHLDFLKEKDPDTLRVTFLSEEIRANFHAGPHSKMGAPLGYDELTVLEDLQSVFNEHGPRRTVLIEKLHPSSSRDEGTTNITPWLTRISVKSAPLSSILWFSDVVIGIHSSALLRAVALGKKTLSYQPGRYEETTAIRMNVCDLIQDRASLSEYLNTVSKNPSESRVRFECIKNDVYENILSLASSDS